MNIPSHINMSFDNNNNSVDIDRNNQMYKRDVNINNYDQGYSPKANNHQPNLNSVHGNQVPDIGLDLILNKKKKAVDYSSDQNSNLFEDSDSNDSPKSMQQNKRTNFFVNNNNQNSNSDSDSDNSSSDNDNQQKFPSNHHHQQQFKHVSEEDIINEKKELLYQFDRLEKRGIKVPKRYSLNSDLEEMKLDYEKLKKEKEVDASIAFQRKCLMAFASGTEFLNSRFDPFDVKLDGWSSSVSDEINTYDDIFEELHEKYSGSSKMMPEMRLLFSLGGSAFMYNLTQKMFSNSLPGMGDVLRQNPDLAKQFASATVNTMSNSGNKEAASFMKFNEGLKPQNKAKMSAPSDIDSILRDLEGDDLDERIDELSTFSDSDMSSEMSINDLLTKKNKKKG